MVLLFSGAKRGGAEGGHHVAADQIRISHSQGLGVPRIVRLDQGKDIRAIEIAGLGQVRAQNTAEDRVFGTHLVVHSRHDHLLARVGQLTERVDSAGVARDNPALLLRDGHGRRRIQ